MLLRSLSTKAPAYLMISCEYQNQKLKQLKKKAKAEVAFLTAQPSYPNVTQLTKLLVTSLKPELSHLLSSHDFGSHLQTELKELLSKFTELIREVKELKRQVHELEIELPRDLKEILNKLETFTSTITSLTSQVIKYASKKTRDTGVPSPGQAGSHPAEWEKNTQQVTISQLFQKKAAKDAKRTDLNKPMPTTTPQTTSVIPPIITTTTTQWQPLFLLNPPKSSYKPEGKLIKKDKGKKAMSSKDTEEEKSKSDSDDDTFNLTGSMVESSKKKKLKKFDFVTEQGEHVHFTEEQIKELKGIKESIKADMAKQEVEVRKEEWIDLFGVDVVTKYYKAKLQFHKYCVKMLNRRAQSRITNCDVLTRKGPRTLKVYREDGTNEIIPNFKANDVYLGEWREVVKACPNRKGAGWSTIYEKIKTRM
ncbi:hypothetical protein Tco_1141422, partial [Tanacetum coccineum]